MIFAIQRYLEDYFVRRGLADVDQYAISVANVVERHLGEADETALTQALARIRTAFYSRNRALRRREFESELATSLRAKFKKKVDDRTLYQFEQSLAGARLRLFRKRRSIGALLREFKSAVQALGIDSFWTSRKRGILEPRPEKNAQALLAVFARGTIGLRGVVLREFGCGVGFVDIGICFGGVLHLVELKVFRGGALKGASQLETYMRTERRKSGWLVIIDASTIRPRLGVPPRILTTEGSIATLVIDVNPSAPSS
jgi:hypothetical protein